MNSFFKSAVAWLDQTSTKTGLLTIAVAGVSLSLGVMTAPVAVPIILAGAVGLLISDKATASAVVTQLEPIALQVAAHPTLVGLTSELPAVLSAAGHIAPGVMADATTAVINSVLAGSKTVEQGQADITSAVALHTTAVKALAAAAA